jgi:long-chain acyl-CoA synthetase
MPSETSDAMSPISQLVAWAHAKPDAPALIVGDTRISYAQLLNQVRARAAWLKTCGVRQGDTVAMVLHRYDHLVVEQIAQFYAVAWLGATIFPVYPEVVPARVGALVDQFTARWIITPTPVPGCRGQTIASDGYVQSIALAADVLPQYSARAPFLFEFTSGTTGSAKAVLSAGQEIADKVFATARAFGWRADDHVVLPRQWPTKVGIKGVVRCLVLGAAYVDTLCPETCDQLSTLIKTQGVSCVGSSPQQLRVLLADATQGHRLRQPLRLLGTAGAMVNTEDIVLARNLLTPNFHVGYGCTEVGVLGHLGPDDPATVTYQILPGIEGQAVDSQGQALAPGENGHLRFRAPWFPHGYALAPFSALEGFHGGWFVTSDWGSVDAQGAITLKGRADDTINFGGAKVLPSDVEQVMRSHPAIADVVVVAIPHQLVGEFPVAYVVLRHAIEPAEFTNYLHDRLESWMVPVETIPVDRLPYNAGGKVSKSDLQKHYLDNLRKE